MTSVTRAQTGTLTAGNNTITSVGNTRGLGAGMPIEGTGVPAGATVASVTSNTIVMSTTATANGSQTITVFTTGYGTGGDTNTVGVKDCVGRLVAGLDPSASRLSSAAALNAGQGSKQAQLSTTHLPAQPAVSGSISGSVSVGAPSINAGLAYFGAVGTEGLTKAALLANAGNASGTANNAPAQAITANAPSASFSGSFSGDAFSGQNATPFSIVPPLVTAECVVVVLP